MGSKGKSTQSQRHLFWRPLSIIIILDRAFFSRSIWAKGWIREHVDIISTSVGDRQKPTPYRHASRRLGPVFADSWEKDI